MKRHGVFILALLIFASLTQARPRYIDTHMHLMATPNIQNIRYQKMMQRRRMRKARGLPVKPLPHKFRRADFKKISYLDSANELVRRMNAMNINKALIVTVPQGRERKFSYKPLFEAVSHHSGRLYVVAGGATLGKMLWQTRGLSASHRLKEQFRQEAIRLKKMGAVAYGEMVLFHFCLSHRHSYQSVPIDGALMKELANLGAKYNMPIDVHLESVLKPMKTPKNLLKACSKNPKTIPATIPAFENLLSYNRKAKFVWQHVGWDNLGQTTPALVSRLLGQHPNLYIAFRVEERPVQVASDLPVPNRIVDHQGRIKKEWLAVFKKYSNRVMVGGDEFIPPTESQRRFPRSFKATWDVIDELPYSIADKIAYENAEKVYGLK